MLMAQASVTPRLPPYCDREKARQAGLKGGKARVAKLRQASMTAQDLRARVISPATVNLASTMLGDHLASKKRMSGRDWDVVRWVLDQAIGKATERVEVTEGMSDAQFIASIRDAISASLHIKPTPELPEIIQED